MYGLLNIHKIAVPLKPIGILHWLTHIQTRQAGRMTRIHHRSSRWTHNIICPKLQTLCRNDTGYKDTARKELWCGIAIYQDCNFPVGEVLKMVRRRLQDDEFLNERCPPPVDTIVDLLELCLKSTFQGQFYQQVNGVVMGSPVSSIVANIFIEEFEQKALASTLNPPRL